MLGRQAGTHTRISIEGMLETLHRQRCVAGGITRAEADDGWRRPIDEGTGFHHDYDVDIALGGWEFHDFGHGMSLGVIDMVAMREYPRKHALGDYLVLSATIAGKVPLRDPDGMAGCLTSGYCTVYGLEAGTEVETVYQPGVELRWVSLFIRRDRLFEATGLTPQDLPEPVRDFLLDGVPLPNRNVPLSQAALLTATQIMACPYRSGFRRAFLQAKSLELACHVLLILGHRIDEDLVSTSISDEEVVKLGHAMQLIERQQEKPMNIFELAASVGMNRQRLQLGFRIVYGDTVARVRDRLRMEHALRLVCDSGRSMIEIALATGYEHPASFTRAFKACYGTSPAQLRRTTLESKNIARFESRLPSPETA
ncbi:MAG: helix-turn-helix domain-containing protein [Lysobacter sp.]